jgi:RNA polymerase-binding transcription factor DksA
MGLTPAETRARARLLLRRAVLARAGQNRTEDPEAELNRIEAALRRIDEGRYGICDGCGAAIGAQVLLANPASPLCAECQARPDRHHGV